MSEPILSGNLEEWHSWRRSVDTQLLAHTESIATLKAYQQVSRDNEAARHSKTPTVTISLVSMGITILFFILQLIVSRIGQ